MRSVYLVFAALCKMRWPKFSLDFFPNSGITALLRERTFAKNVIALKSKLYADKQSC